MRVSIECKLDIKKILLSDSESMLEPVKNTPIILNGKPIGVIKDLENSVLWLDLVPEFLGVVDGQGSLNRLVLGSLNINTEEDKVLHTLIVQKEDTYELHG